MAGVGDLIEGVLGVDPSAEAIEFERRWWTWGELARIGEALGDALTAAGLGAGARIAGIMRNRPEMSAAILKLIGSGRCLVTLNPSMPDGRLADEIIATAPPAIIGFARDWARPELRGAAEAIGCLGLELTCDLDAPIRPIPGLERPVGEGLRRWAEPEVAIEMLTSGTTGPPKRIPLRRITLERTMLDVGVFDKSQRDQGPQLRGGITVVTQPYAHIAGVFALLNAVTAGRKQALLERFTVEGWVDAVRRHRPKVATAPPSALRMILDANVPKEALSSLTAFRTGTAPLDPDLADEFHARYGIPVLQNYSATEFAGAGAGWTLDDWRAHHKDKRGSVGRLNPSLKARIVDADTGDEVPRGEQGLLEVKGPHIADGRNWLRTTDLAVIDADDFLWIKGRADNAIIRGGFKIIPDDVIQALEQHPAIREAAVVGLPDPRLGQVPVAAYRLRAEAPAPSEDELRAFLRERLLAYQVPTRLVVLDEFPRTPSMKVSGPELKKILEFRA